MARRAPKDSSDLGLRTSALGIYVHIPFCSAICNYCNFNRGLLDEALKRQYVDALIREKPDNPYFWEVKGDLLMRNGRIKEAVGPLRQAMKMLPDAAPSAILMPISRRRCDT